MWQELSELSILVGICRMGKLVGDGMIYVILQGKTTTTQSGTKDLTVLPKNRELA